MWWSEVEGSEVEGIGVWWSGVEGSEVGMSSNNIEMIRYCSVLVSEP